MINTAAITNLYAGLSERGQITLTNLKLEHTKSTRAVLDISTATSFHARLPDKGQSTLTKLKLEHIEGYQGSGRSLGNKTSTQDCSTKGKVP